MGHVIGDVQDPEASAIGHLVMHEVERPADIRSGLDNNGRTRATLTTASACWPAAGSVDTELRCLMELEVCDGETEVQPRVQA